MDSENHDEEPIVRFLSIEEKIIEDFRNGRIDCVYAAGYTTCGGKLFDNFGDLVPTAPLLMETG